MIVTVKSLALLAGGLLAINGAFSAVRTARALNEASGGSLSGAIYIAAPWLHDRRPVIADAA